MSILDGRRAYIWKIVETLKRAEIFYILLLLAAALCAFAPLLFGGMLLSGDERIDGYYQFSLFFDSAIARHESFLWNPYSYVGFPTYLNQFGAFLFPPVYILFNILDSFTAFHLVITLALFFGMVFTYFFARSLTLTSRASIIVALSYALVQIPGTYHLGLSYVHSFLVLPLLLLCLVRADYAKNVPKLAMYSFFGAIAIATGFLAGYFVTFVFALVFVGLFAALQDVISFCETKNKIPRKILILSGMMVIGIMLGLPQIIGLHDYASYTARTENYTKEMGASPVELFDAVRIVIPQQFEYPLDPGKGYVYFGFIPLFLICTSFFLRDKITLVFGLIYLIFIGFAINFPIFSFISTHISPFSRMGGVSRWLMVGGLAPAFLAGYAFDHIEILRKRERFVRFWRFFRVFAVVGLCAIASLQIVFYYLSTSNALLEWVFKKILTAKGRSVESLMFDMPHYLAILRDEVVRLAKTFSFLNPDFIIYIALCCGGIFVLNKFVLEENYKWKNWIIVIIFGTFVATFAAGLGSMVPRSEYFDTAPIASQVISENEKDPAEARFVAFQGGEVGRVLGALPEATPRDRMIVMRELLYREVGSAYGLRNVSGFEPIRSRRHNLLIDAALSPISDSVIDIEALKNGASIDTYTHSNFLKTATANEKAADIQKRIPLLSMMNVKYVLSVYPLSHSALNEIPTEKKSMSLVDYYLYENSTVLPMVYFSSDPTFWTGTERDLFVAMLEEKDFSKKAYIECSGCTPRSSSGKSTIVERYNDRLVATTTSSTGGWLVFSESLLPGWIAKVDGKRVPIYPANFLFQAIEVPAGEHMVEFRYSGSFMIFLERIGLRRL